MKRSCEDNDIGLVQPFNSKTTNIHANRPICVAPLQTTYGKYKCLKANNTDSKNK